MSSVLTSYRRGHQGLDLPAVPGFKLMLIILLPYTMMIATAYKGLWQETVLASLGKGNLNEKISSLNCPTDKGLDG